MPTRILVADDDPVLRAIASIALNAQGYEVILARDGAEAVQKFTQENPQIVLMDYQMPVMNGLEACQEIRARAGSRYVPVVMLTARSSTDLLQRSLEAGAIEFLSKPFEPEELGSRVRALAELVHLHHDLVDRKAQDDEEIAVVKHVLERYQAIGHASLPPTFTMETVHTRRINGDTCLYRQGLPGIHFGLLCDATGHGLMAGVSTIPVAEAFLSMVTKDIPLSTIYREINFKLRRILPADRFVCMLIFRINTHQNVLSVLNAGMPDAWFHPARGGVRAFPSTELPAGIRDLDTDDIPVMETQVQPGDRFLAFSDGVLDLFSPEEAKRLLLVEPASVDIATHQERIRSQLRARVEDSEQIDDISWALWEVPPTALMSPAPAEASPTERGLRPGLEVRFILRPKQHNVRDMLPSILGVLPSEGIDQETLQLLALLLSEALSNAVDHGLLRLDSTLKDQDGFEAYETARQRALDQLMDGTLELTIGLRHDPQGRPAWIDVCLEDSGPGFNWRETLSREFASPTQSHGRGLSILHTMARDLSFNEAGNQVMFKLSCRES